MENEQQTITTAVGLSGIGLHTGEQTHVQILPGGPDLGIEFWKMQGDTVLDKIPALVSNASSGNLRTVIGNNDTRIETIEHLLSAIFGMEIDNAVIKVWGNEIPIMDGSSIGWVNLLRGAGVTKQIMPRQKIVIKKEIVVGNSTAWCSLQPATGDHLTIRYDLSYPHGMIGHQRLGIRLSKRMFIDNLAASRTFGFLRDFDSIRSIGLAKGASQDNVLVFNDVGIVGSDRLRWADEPVRHKMVDVLGDLALAGRHLVGVFTGYRSGHALNQRLVSKLLLDADAWYLSVD